MSRTGKSVLAGLFMVAVLIGAMAAHADIITSGLIGRWSFDEGYGITAADSSGAGLDGTVEGAAHLTIGDAERGNVLTVSGTSGRVTYPFSSTLEPAAGTIAVWVKPSLAKTADVVRKNTDLLYRSNETGMFYAYCLRVTERGEPVAILANDSAQRGRPVPQTVATGRARTVPVEEWTHLAMTWDGTGTLALFVNGKQAKAVKYYPNPTYGLSYHGNFPLEVASAIWTFNDGHLEYSGSVSDLRMYSRALTSAEIASIASGSE
jgi:hypothetical protein